MSSPTRLPNASSNELLAVIDRHAQELSQPGVVSIRPGFKMENDWPTKEPAIVVIKSKAAGVPSLPSRIEGIAVDVREATPIEELRHQEPQKFANLAAQHPEMSPGAFPEMTPGGTEEAAPAEAAKPRIDYQPASLALSPVTGKLSFTCHASPDAGWPTLKDFLSKTTSTLTVGLYDFTSKHILDALENDLAAATEVKITLDNPARNPTADQSDTETLQALGQQLGGVFSSAWALVRSNPAISSWIFPTAYHIKVAVRDNESVWLSSGNWNNSNQPDMDPIGDPQSTDQQTARKSDRDWHIIVDNADLAKTFEAYLKHDYTVADEIARTGAVTEAALLQEVIPESFEPEARALWQFFPPLKLEQEEATITPLLTPDKDVYQPAMLRLVESATEKLYIQLQYIHPSTKPEDAGFSDLIAAVAAKIDHGVDVRIILSQYQTSQGWLERLQSAGVDLSAVKIQNGVHNKGFVVDSKVVALGSQNWSGDGALRNRDASVIIENANAAEYYEKIFLHDWDNVARQSVKP